MPLRTNRTGGELELSLGGARVTCAVGGVGRFGGKRKRTCCTPRSQNRSGLLLITALLAANSRFVSVHCFNLFILVLLCSFPFRSFIIFCCCCLCLWRYRCRYLHLCVRLCLCLRVGVRLFRPLFLSLLVLSSLSLYIHKHNIFSLSPSLSLASVSIFVHLRCAHLVSPAGSLWGQLRCENQSVSLPINRAV